MIGWSATHANFDSVRLDRISRISVGYASLWLVGHSAWWPHGTCLECQISIRTTVELHAFYLHDLGRRALDPVRMNHTDLYHFYCCFRPRSFDQRKWRRSPSPLNPLTFVHLEAAGRRKRIPIECVVTADFYFGSISPNKPPKPTASVETSSLIVAWRDRRWALLRNQRGNTSHEFSLRTERFSISSRLLIRWEKFTWGCEKNMSKSRWPNLGHLQLHMLCIQYNKNHNNVIIIAPTATSAGYIAFSRALCIICFQLFWLWHRLTEKCSITTIFSWVSIAVAFESKLIERQFATISEFIP